MPFRAGEKGWWVAQDVSQFPDSGTPLLEALWADVRARFPIDQPAHGSRIALERKVSICMAWVCSGQCLIKGVA